MFPFGAASAGIPSASAKERLASEPNPQRGRTIWLGAAVLVGVLAAATYLLGSRSDGSDVIRAAAPPAPSAAALHAANADAGPQSLRDAAGNSHRDAAVEVKPKTPKRGASQSSPKKPLAKPTTTSTENPLFLP